MEGVEIREKPKRRRRGGEEGDENPPWLLQIEKESRTFPSSLAARPIGAQTIRRDDVDFFL
jgi:hypothetical protein